MLKRLDQGHLHPTLEVPRLTCLGRETNPDLRGGRRAPSKELFEQRINSYSACDKVNFFQICSYISHVVSIILQLKSTLPNYKYVYTSQITQQSCGGNVYEFDPRSFNYRMFVFTFIVV
jgi:hypothetical protein